MARFLAQARLAIGACIVLLIVAIAFPAGAQQPSSVNPTASSVKAGSTALHLPASRCNLPTCSKIEPSSSCSRPQPVSAKPAGA